MWIGVLGERGRPLMVAVNAEFLGPVSKIYEICWCFRGPWAIRSLNAS
jgi:hypothetical protein